MRLSDREGVANATQFFSQTTAFFREIAEFLQDCGSLLRHHRPSSGRVVDNL